MIGEPAGDTGDTLATKLGCDQVPGRIRTSPPPVAPMCEEYKNELTEYLTMLIQENQKRKTAKLEELAAALPGPPGRGGGGGEGAEGKGPAP